MWWDQNKINYPHITKLVINLDNGPNSASNRTQFIRRMVEFAEKSGLQIRLAYYPPYHSKYNPVERCWGVLEEHWNGEILDSVKKTMNWASTMTWKGIKPIVHFCDKIYQKGVREFMGNNIPSANGHHTHYPEFSMQKWVVLLS